LTQHFLERNRERRASSRARLLIAGELLNAQAVLRAASNLDHWLPVEDKAAFLPTDAWRENRSSLVSDVDGDLYNALVMAYALIETDRSRFVAANRLPANTPFPTKEAEGIKEFCNELGRLRRKLGGGGAWPDEIEEEFKHRMKNLKI